MGFGWRIFAKAGAQKKVRNKRYGASDETDKMQGYRPRNDVYSCVADLQQLWRQNVLLLQVLLGCETTFQLICDKLESALNNSNKDVNSVRVVRLRRFLANCQAAPLSYLPYLCNVNWLSQSVLRLHSDQVTTETDG